MTSKKERKFRKQKVKERETRKKVLARREELRKPAQEDRAHRRRMKRIAKLQHDMDEFQHIETEKLLEASEDQLVQLEKNVKILRALEKEYEDEFTRREELNRALEEQGCFDLDDKLAYSLEMLKNDKETAEVTVVKAPQNENPEETSKAD